jgi:hypothetical protein
MYPLEKKVKNGKNLIDVKTPVNKSTQNLKWISNGKR